MPPAAGQLGVSCHTPGSVDAGRENCGGDEPSLSAQRDHLRRRGLTRRNAAALGQAVRDRGQRRRILGIEIRRRREVVLQHRVRGGYRRGIRRCVRRRDDGSEVRL